MTQQNTTETERLWTYDAVRVGQDGGATEVTISDADVAEYAACAQNPDPRYQMPPVGSAAPPLLAMPTMALTYAPLRTAVARRDRRSQRIRGAGTIHHGAATNAVRQG